MASLIGGGPSLPLLLWPLGAPVAGGAEQDRGSLLAGAGLEFGSSARRAFS